MPYFYIEHLTGDLRMQIDHLYDALIIPESIDYMLLCSKPVQDTQDICEAMNCKSMPFYRKKHFIFMYVCEHIVFQIRTFLTREKGLFKKYNLLKINIFKIMAQILKYKLPATYSFSWS